MSASAQRACLEENRVIASLCRMTTVRGALPIFAWVLVGKIPTWTRGEESVGIEINIGLPFVLQPRTKLVLFPNVEKAISDGGPYRNSYFEPEVGFEEIVIDLPQSRFWIVCEYPTNHTRCGGIWAKEFQDAK